MEQRIHSLSHPVYGSVATFDNRDLISARIRRQELWEVELCERLAQHYVPDTDVLDIGANMGFNTLLMHRTKPITGTVHLFEPQYDVFAVLEYNSRHLPKRRLYNICLGGPTPTALGYTQSAYNIGPHPSCVTPHRPP